MSEVINKKIGQRLRSARTYEGLSQTELSATLGVTPSSVCNWEKGLRALPPGQVVAICIALGTTADFLFGLSENIKPTPLNGRVPRR